MHLEVLVEDQARGVYLELEEQHQLWGQVVRLIQQAVLTGFLVQEQIIQLQLATPRFLLQHQV